MRASFARALKLGIAAALLPAGTGMAVAACGPETTIAPSVDFVLTFKVCDSSFVGAVTARAAGWVAVGFSPDQYMPDTDTFMAGISEDGMPYGRDGFAYFRGPPVIDPSQDVSLLDAAESNGTTSFSFTRLLRTGDPMDFDLSVGSYHILTAFNAISDDLTARHTYADASDLAYTFSPVPEAQQALMALAGLAAVAGLTARHRRR